MCLKKSTFYHLKYFSHHILHDQNDLLIHFAHNNKCEQTIANKL